MAISLGTRLGPYEILSPLGAGGMGEVYKAKDTRVDRTVALKVPPEEFFGNDERRTRFGREAKLLASLNHPGIATLYSFEEISGRHVLTMELIEGEDLSQRLASGPLPLEEALAFARQIAEALEAAHEKGVIHRDLKPSNIRVTPGGRIKLLDFGIAKLAEPAERVDPESPTMTAAGIVLGTPAYMSPEQVRGQAVDRRTDIWSLGCVLYEMLAGKRAFDGRTVSDVLAGVLQHEPDLSRLPQATPAAARHLLSRCLEKDANRRLRDAGDARLEIEAVEAGLRSDGGRRLSGRAKAGVALTAMALAAVAVLAYRKMGVTASERAPQPNLTQLTSATGVEQFPAWAPDGARLLYAAESGAVRKIFVKSLAAGEERQLTSGDFDDIQPAWSPDGRTVLFVRSQAAGKRLEPGDVFGQYDGGDVWSLDIESGKETKILQKAFDPSFSPDGSRIAVDANFAGPRRIWLVDASGSNPQQLTTDVTEAVSHVRPRWSPDGTKVVFQNVERTKFHVRVADVATKTIAWVTNDLYRELNPAFSPSGKWIYFSSDRTGGLNIWRLPVRPDGVPSGAPQQLTTGAGQDVDIAISRDGRRLAFAILQQNADLWKLPVSPETGRAEGAPQQILATTREESRGAWSPDGTRIAFNSDRAGDMNIWILTTADGSTRRLTKGSGGDYQPEWSPDARRIVFFSARSGNADVWSADVDSGALTQLTKSPSIDINPFFSPDGSRIAYQSDQSGRLEAWVMNADGSAPRQLSHEGVSGHFLRWTPNGQSILLRCTCGGTPQTLRAPLSGEEPQPVGEMVGGAHMSLSPDASRIMDVLSHKTLWVSPLGGKPEMVFAFDEAESRIDYPVWSPDGHWVLFDRFRPHGGDIWMMEKFEEGRSP
jgi:eukaryotic-like serine/threonine-protein kinase